ncbi:fatty acyl-CoA reductase 3-like [Chenopodium quinoa]|uniref:fatty acyl-CoA reductase 3-like n=1 Tax=Chenopodium quinoa TaxID=63459 RepID=UPI000B782654|nr:fatty acyl-CoA reductase 3-like [Chenopodium quinoa]
MEAENGVEFLCNKTLLVTGATGFLAKGDDLSLIYIIAKELFQVLREVHGAKFDSFISKKVAPIDGDTSLINLGLNDDNEIYKEIDVIIHSAAVTKFQERYNLSLEINTLGAKNVLQYAKTCPKLQILLHVSTAYVCRQKAGLIPETLCKTLSDIVGLNIEVEKKLVDNKLNDLARKGASTKKIRDTMKSLGQKRANMYGWVNTYAFTKAMGEMLIWEHKEDLPIVIVRPTMIGSTYKEPFPCWIESVGSISMLSIVYGKGLTHFTHADSNAIIDMIPVDMVVNSIIMGMVANANKPCLTIYHVGSSMRNPLALHKLVENNYRYFNNNPWIDAQGMPVNIKKALLVKGRLHFSMLLVRDILKLMVLKIVDGASCHKFNVNQEKLEFQIKVSATMAMVFRHYLFFVGIFDDENTEKLRRAMSKEGMDGKVLNFDPNCINWDDYLLNNHIPATVKYLF